MSQAMAHVRPFCHRLLHWTGAPRRNFFSYRKKPAERIALDSLNVSRFSQRRERYNSHRLAFLWAGALAGTAGCILISVELFRAIRLSQTNDKAATHPSDSKMANAPIKGAGHASIRLDGSDGLVTDQDGVKRKIVVRDDLGREAVPTGVSTIETFPRTVELMPPQCNSISTDATATAPQSATTEYMLVGLGLRTVTMFRIQAYLVGLYIAKDDVARLQKHLIRRINPTATTLVPSECDSLRHALLDHARGENEWDALLRETGCRTLFRIIPVRDTSLSHMRDAFVTAATSRGSQRGYMDQEFGNTVGEFKRFFGRGSAAKGQEILLCRDGSGQLVVMFGDGKSSIRKKLGTVVDERFSRILWLNYLSGKKVASEQARTNIVHGVVELVERPIGTVKTQVVG